MVYWPVPTYILENWDEARNYAEQALKIAVLLL